MSKDLGMSTPSGMGGLVRYDSEYKSKFNLSPTQVIIFVVLVLIFVLALKIFFPVAEVVNTPAPTNVPIGLILSLIG